MLSVRLCRFVGIAHKNSLLWNSCGNDGRSCYEWVLSEYNKRHLWMESDQKHHTKAHSVAKTMSIAQAYSFRHGRDWSSASLAARNTRYSAIPHWQCVYLCSAFRVHYHERKTAKRIHQEIIDSASAGRSWNCRDSFWACKRLCSKYKRVSTAIVSLNSGTSLIALHLRNTKTNDTKEHR